MQVLESHQCPLCESNEVGLEDSLAGEQLLKLWKSGMRHWLRLRAGLSISALFEKPAQ
jgi:hypothetical protein